MSCLKILQLNLNPFPTILEHKIAFSQLVKNPHLSMKVLYAIQGTGNGHLSRARDIIPVLLDMKVDLDLLVSGIQADIELPYPVKYRLKGLSFIFGKRGGVDIWHTYLKSNSKRLQNEIKSIPVAHYDLILNDFEPVSAWACKQKKKACISLSHQAAVISREAPKPKKKDPLGSIILKNYAPTSKSYGLHFKAYNENTYTPIIRQEIRQQKISVKDHFTVYLPSYSDEKIIKILSEVKGVKWKVFSKHFKKEFTNQHVTISPIDNEKFIKSLASCRGVFCGAGFETPAEALFMNKKILAIPMKGQYEQQCNAAALQEMGVPIIKALKKKHISKITEWTQSEHNLKVHYPDKTKIILETILANNLNP